MENEWRSHPIYKNYVCNANGDIKSLITNKLMKQHDVKGYLYVHLTINSQQSKFVLAHRFILESFSELNDLDVNHINGNKHDNRLINLEWCTKSENCIHREEVIKTGNSKEVLCVETGIVYNSTKEAERITGINQSNINQVALNKRKTAGGFSWRFV